MADQVVTVVDGQASNIALLPIEDKPFHFIALTEQGMPGIQGIPGQQGPAGVGTGFTGKAGQIVNGNRFVTYDASFKLINATDHNTVGMSTNSAIVDGEVSVVSNGIVEDSSWNWEPNKKLYLNSNGLFSHTPEALWIKEVGMAISATKIMINIQMTILTGV